MFENTAIIVNTELDSLFEVEQLTEVHVLIYFCSY